MLGGVGFAWRKWRRRSPVGEYEPLRDSYSVSMWSLRDDA